MKLPKFIPTRKIILTIALITVLTIFVRAMYLNEIANHEAAHAGIFSDYGCSSVKVVIAQKIINGIKTEGMTFCEEMKNNLTQRGIEDLTFSHSLLEKSAYDHNFELNKTADWTLLIGLFLIWGFLPGKSINNSERVVTDDGERIFPQDAPTLSEGRGRTWDGYSSEAQERKTHLFWKRRGNNLLHHNTRQEGKGLQGP